MVVDVVYALRGSFNRRAKQDPRSATLTQVEKLGILEEKNVLTKVLRLGKKFKDDTEVSSGSQRLNERFHSETRALIRRKPGRDS